MKDAKKILIQFAMAAEATPFLAQLGFSPSWESIGPGLPGKAVRGAIGSRAIVIQHTGVDERLGVSNVGPHPAAVTAYAAMLSDAPDLVISAGTAGGFSRHKANVGDVYISSGKICFHDRRIPIAGYDIYGAGNYPCLDLSNLASELGMKSGIISTGSSLDASKEDLDQLAMNEAVVKDMEAAAVGWVAWQFRKPMVAVKAITDLVDFPVSTPAQFFANFDLAVSRLAEKMDQLMWRI